MNGTVNFYEASETGAINDARDILKERAQSMANPGTKKPGGFTPKMDISDPEDSARFIVTAMVTTIWTLVCFFGGVAVGVIFF